MDLLEPAFCLEHLRAPVRALVPAVAPIRYGASGAPAQRPSGFGRFPPLPRGQPTWPNGLLRVRAVAGYHHHA